MILFPAIDLYEGKAVRLFKGDYAQMTVYSEHPEEIAKDFAAKGSSQGMTIWMFWPPCWDSRVKTAEKVSPASTLNGESMRIVC